MSEKDIDPPLTNWAIYQAIFIDELESLQGCFTPEPKTFSPRRRPFTPLQRHLSLQT